MRLVISGLFAALALALGSAARADPAYEAGAAMGACLAAVIDRAPVADMTAGGVTVHRETQPNLCSVTVAGGDPAEVRREVTQALAERPEQFAPAKTAWDPGPLAVRETLCNAPGRRALNVVVEAGRPGAPVTLKATVIEAAARDPRCDRDFGLQR